MLTMTTLALLITLVAMVDSFSILSGTNYNTLTSSRVLSRHMPSDPECVKDSQQ